MPAPQPRGAAGAGALPEGPATVSGSPAASLELVAHADATDVHLRVAALSADLLPLLAERDVDLVVGDVVVEAHGRLVPGTGPLGPALLAAWRTAIGGVAEMGWLPPVPGAEPVHFATVAIATGVSVVMARSGGAATGDSADLIDEMTGLPRRRTLMTVLTERCVRARTGGEPFSVLFVDVDGLKDLNDVFGHPAGDDLLRAVATRLSGAIRTGDVVARVGGDEFVIVADEVTDEPMAHALCERILRTVSATVDIAGMPVNPSISVGVAIADGSRDAPELIQDADLAMYRAKAAGRNRAAFYEPAMRLAAMERFLTVHGFTEALASDELLLHFQPVFFSEDLSPGGAEALLRWRHPRRGLLFPEQFLPAVDAGNLAVPVGEWVIDRVVAAAGAWRHYHDLAGYRLGMNIAPRHLMSGTVVPTVESAMERYGADPNHLVVEIVETEHLEAREETIRQIRNLREIGLRVAVDDFGTGAAGLHYLRDLPVDLVKIDRRLIRADPTERDHLMLSGIVRMCDDLGITVLLEGVENVAQLTMAQECGVMFVQGFLLSRPVPAFPGPHLPVPDPLIPARS